jgi:hypothetical protein
MLLPNLRAKFLSPFPEFNYFTMSSACLLRRRLRHQSPTNAAMTTINGSENRKISEGVK